MVSSQCVAQNHSIPYYPKMANLTQSRLKELLHYDPETGVFIWRIRRGGTIQSGSVAGSKQIRKNLFYVRIVIDLKPYYAHRLAWIYMTGKDSNNEIDHKDTNGLNNRWDNLREATRSQNMANSKCRNTNVSGFKGASLHGSRWRSQITFKRQNFVLGQYDTPEEAHAAYCEAAMRLYGNFARAR